MLQKKKNEGEKKVAVCMVHGLESQCRHRYCVSCRSLGSVSLRWSGEAEKGVAIRGALKKFCRCGGGFDPGFGDANQIWMVGIDETRQSGRVRVSKNGTDV